MYGRSPARLPGAAPSLPDVSTQQPPLDAKCQRHVMERCARSRAMVSASCSTRPASAAGRNRLRKGRRRPARGGTWLLPAQRRSQPSEHGKTWSVSSPASVPESPARPSQEGPQRPEPPGAHSFIFLYHAEPRINHFSSAKLPLFTTRIRGDDYNSLGARCERSHIVSCKDVSPTGKEIKS